MPVGPNSRLGIGAILAALTAAAVVVFTSIQTTTIELGHASDTTLARVSAGLMSVENGNVPLENRANSFSADQTMTGGANAFTVGTPTADTTSDVLFEASAATQTPLGLELATSQTANAFEVKSQGGTIVNALDASGYPMGNAARFWYGADHFVTPSGFSSAVGPLAIIRNISGTGTNVVQLSNYNSALGVARVESGTDTNSRAHLGSNSTSPIAAGYGRLVFKTKCDLSALSDGTETYTVHVGFFDSNTGASNDGAYFAYTHGTNGGEYQAVNANGGVRTETDTNVVAAAGTWATFEIDLSAASSAVTYKINGTSVSTVATNLPAAGTEFTFGVQIIKSAGTTERYLYCDYMELLVVPTSQ